MKRNDARDFCILYLEPSDEREALLRAIAGQHKPVVLMLAEGSRLFQRPEEFVALKYLKSQLNVAIYFVVAPGERPAQMESISATPLPLPLTQSSNDPACLPPVSSTVRSRLDYVSAEMKGRIESISATPLTLPLTQSSNDPACLPPVNSSARSRLDYVSAEITCSLAERNGFPVYKSMDAFSDALMMEYSARQHILPRAAGEPTSALYSAPRKTVPLTPLEEIVAHMETMPLPVVSPSLQAVRSSTPRPITLQARQPNISDATSGTGNQLDYVPEETNGRPALPPKRVYSRLPAVLIVLMILALSGGGLGSLLVLYHPAPVTMQRTAPLAIVGHVYFLNSGQVNENTNQGIDDEVQIDLSNLASPAPGKSYFAWLLGDKNQGNAIAIFLGVLGVKNGKAYLFYTGDQSHTNLLAFTSRFLVTEEDSSVIPVAPSPDYGTWRYYGELLQTPLQAPGSMSADGGITHSSFLDHLRYLLATDPMLDQNELPGGLNNWFSHNVEKVLELTSSTRESWQEGKDMSFIRSQTVQTLAYLDGLSYISNDLLPNTSLDFNDRFARIGLIEANGPNQDPPSYLDSVVIHLNALVQTGGSKATLRKDVTEIIAALNNVRYWLGQVRKDAQQIVKMTDGQLLQSSTLTLINSMIENASSAYAGRIDPTTGKMQEGVNWIHDYIQTLAVFEITAYRASISPIQIIPDTRPSVVVWYKYEGES